MITWKVWTAAAEDPAFEGNEANAVRYVMENLADSPHAVLESPDADSYAYVGGAWRCLDTDEPWEPASGLPRRPA